MAPSSEVDRLTRKPTGGALRRPTDAELIAYLRADDVATRTVADVVVDMRVSIARAQKIHRFWLAHDAHPAAARARAARGASGAAADRPAGGIAPRFGKETALPSSELPPASPAPPSAPDPTPGERRAPERLARASLIQQLRSPDPVARATAFDALKRRRTSADGK